MTLLKQKFQFLPLDMFRSTQDDASHSLCEDMTGLSIDHDQSINKNCVISEEKVDVSCPKKITKRKTFGKVNNRNRDKKNCQIYIKSRNHIYQKCEKIYFKSLSVKQSTKIQKPSVQVSSPQLYNFPHIRLINYILSRMLCL